MLVKDVMLGMKLMDVGEISLDGVVKIPMKREERRNIMGINERAFAITVLCGVVGVLLAITVQLLNSAGILVDEFITGTITLREVQLMIIIIWIVMGTLISAFQK